MRGRVKAGDRTHYEIWECIEGSEIIESPENFCGVDRSTEILCAHKARTIYDRFDVKKFVNLRLGSPSCVA